MAERYNERDDRDRWRDAGEYSGRGEYYRTRGRELDRGPGPRRDRDREDDRGFMDRAGDEVRSWFGDEEAARRREIDERHDGRDRERYWNRDEGWRNVPERDRYRISDDWNQREYSARTGTSWGTSAGSSDWRGRGPLRSEWRGETDWRREPGWGSTERPRTGRHAGKGPRNYQRSDDRINEEVCDLLTRDPDVDASGIEVAVVTGEVTLRGHVDSRFEKRAAEDIAESVHGVRQVHNELRTNSSTTESDPDPRQVTPTVTK